MINLVFFQHLISINLDFKKTNIFKFIEVIYQDRSIKSFFLSFYLQMDRKLNIIINNLQVIFSMIQIKNTFTKRNEITMEKNLNK